MKKIKKQEKKRLNREKEKLKLELDKERKILQIEKEKYKAIEAERDVKQKKWKKVECLKKKWINLKKKRIGVTMYLLNPIQLYT